MWEAKGIENPWRLLLPLPLLLARPTFKLRKPIKLGSSKDFPAAWHFVDEVIRDEQWKRSRPSSSCVSLCSVLFCAVVNINSGISNAS
jgi:hypothetical protein